MMVLIVAKQSWVFKLILVERQKAWPSLALEPMISGSNGKCSNQIDKQLPL